MEKDTEKGAAIAEQEPPSAVKELRQYLGVVSWYRRLVPDFPRIVKPLNDLLRIGSYWEWTPEHQMAFEEVKARPGASICPDFSRTFILQTDASDYGIGAILTQDTEKGERVISYSSRTLNGAFKKLFNNGEGVLGDRLGDPKAQTISHGPEVAQQHRKLLRKDRQMGAGAATVGL